MATIYSYTDNRWVHYRSSECTEELEERISGKYLIFSPDLENLTEIAENELINHGFYFASTSKPDTNFGDNYVLNLYDVDGTRLYELKQRIQEDYNINKARGRKSYIVKFKLNSDTEAGIFSNQFKDDVEKWKEKKFFEPVQDGEIEQFFNSLSNEQLKKAEDIFKEDSDNFKGDSNI